MSFCYLDPDDIRQLHADALARFGGTYGEHNPGMISYMAEKPFLKTFGQEAYPGLFLKAAVYFDGFARNQYFVDGNKRTGVACALTFLMINGCSLEADPEMLYEISIQVAVGQMRLHELAEWLERHSI